MTRGVRMNGREVPKEKVGAFFQGIVAGMKEGQNFTVEVYRKNAAGEPEFYISNGHVIDGVFVPEQNQYGDSLIRTRYAPQQNPPTVHEDAADFDGRVRMDFNAAADAAACRDDGESADAVMSFVLPGTAANTVDQWCMQQIGAGLEVANDLTNIWFDPSDPGWGVSTRPGSCCWRAPPVSSARRPSASACSTRSTAPDSSCGSSQKWGSSSASPSCRGRS